jgi:hypothetical protein
LLIYTRSIEKYSHEKGKNRIFILIMTDLVSVEEANGAESLLQQLMCCIWLFILLIIISLTHSKNQG